MYNNPYYQNAYSSQVSIDRINNQIADLEKMRQQLQQPPQPPITQNFQLAPNGIFMRYANNIEEVQREAISGDTPYFSKDMSIVWIKNIKGEIKSYELTEIVPKDERDLLIDSLQMQVNELRKEMINNEQYISNDDETSTSKNDGAVRATTKKSESSSVSTISTSKAK